MGIYWGRCKIRKSRSGIRKPNRFQTMFRGGEFVILGRSPFGSGAKKIVVNQNKAKGHVQDRRHILHYDEVLKPAIERVISNLFVSQGGDKSKVVLLVRGGCSAGVSNGFPGIPTSSWSAWLPRSTVLLTI